MASSMNFDTTPNRRGTVALLGLAAFVVSSLPSNSFAEPQSRAMAKQLVERVGRQRGICVVLGGDPDVALEIARISELLVNFASPLDLQIGLGTRILGNMDGTRHGGAGAKGFNTDHPKLLQIPWRSAMMRQGHPGNHIAYLSPPWQRKYLFPALDPAQDPAELHQTLRQ